MAGWPRSIRWTGAILVGLAIAWVLLVPAADWLAHHDVGSASGALLQTARNGARGQLLGLGAGVGAAGALIFTARNFTLGRRTFELTEQGQVTDRYTKAIEQLGSDKSDVRIGGIYALERVARDSARDHPTVIEVLAAFIREHSREPWPLPDNEGAERERSTRPDVQAAITVIARRNAERDIRPIDLTRADLIGASLHGAPLIGADLTRANLWEADLVGADLTRARLRGADLTRANLHGANLAGAKLTHVGGMRTDIPRVKFTPADLERSGCVKIADADLTNANLRDADLFGVNSTGAFFSGAILINANLAQADLAGAYLADTDLTGTNLRGANLAGAYLVGANLTDADLADTNLTRAVWSEDVPVPDGWTLGTSTCQLEASDDSGAAEGD